MEQELQAVREELAEAERELEHKENAPIEGRVADEDRYMVKLLALENRVRALREEERRLTIALEQGEPWTGSISSSTTPT